MFNLFLCYSKCGTCRKAEKWLLDKGIEFEKRDIKTDNPNKDELKKWQEMSGLPLKKFFNTSGQSYRSMGLKDKLLDMTEDEMLELLASDGMLVKRPIFITGENKVLVGFKEITWEESLGL